MAIRVFMILPLNISDIAFLFLEMPGRVSAPYSDFPSLCKYRACAAFFSVRHSVAAFGFRPAPLRSDLLIPRRQFPAFRRAVALFPLLPLFFIKT